MEKILEYEGRKIFYRNVGKGMPLMLVHGFGEDGEIWNNQLSFLKDGFNLIIPDLPGSGRSEMISDMGMEGMAELLNAIATSENFEKFTLIGHSMGGYISLAFAEKYSNRLNGFGLFHSSAYADSDEKKATRKKGIDFIQQHGSYDFLKTAIPVLFSPDSQSRIPNSINQLIERGRNFSPAALVSYYEAMMQRPERLNVLKNSRVPVFFIIGKYDNAVPMKDSLAQCHLPRISYIHILENSGHMGMLEEVEKSVTALKQYLIHLAVLNPVLQ
ncbi:MAG: alpha/beta hydrolase [Chitinophagaceae bacterium]